MTVTMVTVTDVTATMVKVTTVKVTVTVRMLKSDNNGAPYNDERNKTTVTGTVTVTIFTVGESD